MAAPYRRPNSPYWWIDLTIDGKRVRKSTKRTSLKEARAVQQEMMKQVLNEAQFSDTKELTLRDALFDHYLPTRKNNASYKDLKRYCKTLCGDREGTASLKGDMKFHELTTSMLRQYRAKRLADGVSEQTVDHEVKCVSAAYNMVKEDYRVRVGLTFPMARVKGKPRYLTPDEEKALLEELQPLRVRRSRGTGFHYLDPLARMAKQRTDNYDLVVCLLDTGCRYSELAHLTWGMVDNQEFSWVHIFRDKVNNQGRLATTARMREVLRRRYKSRGNSHFVFPGWDRGSVNEDVPRHSTAAIRRAMARVGINSPTNVARFGLRNHRHQENHQRRHLRRRLRNGCPRQCGPASAGTHVQRHDNLVRGIRHPLDDRCAGPAGRRNGGCMNDNDTLQDVSGNTLKIGSRVAFAALSYRRAGLRVGEIVEIDPGRRDAARVYEPKANRREWRRPDSLAVTT